MARGCRRTVVEGGGDAERSGNRPYGTEQSLEVGINRSQDISHVLKMMSWKCATASQCLNTRSEPPDIKLCTASAV